MVGGRSVSTHDLFRRPLEHIVPPTPIPIPSPPQSATPTGMTPTLCTFRHSQQGALIDKRNAVAGARNGDSE